MNNYAPYFNALEVLHWESGRYGTCWWAFAIDRHGNKVKVDGYNNEKLALDAILAELSALVH